MAATPAAYASPALIIIDVQEGFKEPFWGQRNNPQAETVIARLLKNWREADHPIYHVQHLSRNPRSPLRPGQSGVEIMAQAKPLPGETLIQKSVNSAFIGTDLETRLRKAGHKDVVIAGLTTDHCVSTTARMAANLGFNVTVVEDAVATFDRVGFDGAKYSAERVHHLALASLHGEFAEVVQSEALLERLDTR